MRSALALLMTFAGSGLTLANFVAHNDLVDLSNATNNANVTEIGLPPGGAQHGVLVYGTPGKLVDHATGALTNVSLQVNTLNAYNSLHSGPPAWTGDAAAEFGTAVSQLDFVKEGNVRIATYDVWVDLVFTDMDPAKHYTVVLSGNRGGNAGRIAEFTISDVDAFTNTSSAGTFSGPTSPTASFDTGVNSAGNVARFSAISPGLDGDMTVRVNPLMAQSQTSTTLGRFFLNQVKLVEVPEPTALVLLAAGSLAMLRRRRG